MKLWFYFVKYYDKAILAVVRFYHFFSGKNFSKKLIVAK
jgi:hypothetical protein